MCVRKRSNKWWVDFSFNGSRYRRPSPENSKAGALAWELVLKQRLARGEPLDPKKEKITFKDFARDWFETYVKNNNKHSEILSKERILRVHLTPHFENSELEEINNLEIEKYKARKISQELSFKSINNHLAVLRKALQCAVEWGAIEHLPLVKRLKTPPQKYDFLTQEECRQLLDSSDGIWRDMIVVALETGMRFGEIIALRWEDLDFKSGELTVTQAYAEGVLGSPKSNQLRRIPMSDSVLHILNPTKNTKGLVFSDSEGNPFKRHVCNEKLRSICKRAGLRRIGWHILRHTFASHLAQAGANLTAIQRLLGHSDIRTTMRYAHINRAVLREAIDVLDKANAGFRNSCHNSVTNPAFAVKISELRKSRKGKNSAKDTEKESRSSLL